MRNSPSELKNIEKMVNGLDGNDKTNNGSMHDDRESPKIDLVDQWHDEKSQSTQYFLREADTVLNASHSSANINEPLTGTVVQPLLV